MINPLAEVIGSNQEVGRMPDTETNGVVSGDSVVSYGVFPLTRYIEETFGPELERLWSFRDRRVGFVVTNDPATVLSLTKHGVSSHKGSECGIRVADAVQKWLSGLSDDDKHQLRPKMMLRRPGGRLSGWMATVCTSGDHITVYFLPAWY